MPIEYNAIMLRDVIISHTTKEIVELYKKHLSVLSIQEQIIAKQILADIQYREEHYG
jgi:hypothetical protein